MEKLTPWYDPKVDGQPVREGWYQRKYSNYTALDYWSGSVWRYEKHEEEAAFFQHRKWRGLTSPSEGYHV